MNILRNFLIGACIGLAILGVCILYLINKPVEATYTPTPRCEPEQVTPTPTPTNTPTPTPTPTQEPTPTPTEEPTPTLTEKPKEAGSSAVLAPVSPPAPTEPICVDLAPNKAPDNFHIYRKGDYARPVWFYDASVTWKVVVYYGLNGKGDQHSVILNNQDSGKYLIKGLGTRDYSFRAEFLNGCANGSSTKVVVDGNSAKEVLFR